MRHVTCVNDSCHAWLLTDACLQLVTWLVWMRFIHVNHVNVVMSHERHSQTSYGQATLTWHVWMRFIHVTRVNVVMSHERHSQTSYGPATLTWLVWMRFIHVTHVNARHGRTSYVTCMNDSCYTWLITDAWLQLVTWHVRMRFSHVTHVNVRHLRTSYGRTTLGSIRLILPLFAKEPLIIRLFCRKWPMKIRHPMTPRHPLWSRDTQIWSCDSR